MSRILHPAPLTEAAFAPFGTVATLPAAGQRVTVGPPENARPAVPPRLVWLRARAATLPLAVTTMERHAYSSQSFVPMGEARWLILVAPHAPDGGPDMARAEAFLADGTQAITYRPDTWHHPLTALSEGVSFAVLTFLDGSKEDEEFVAVPAGLTVVL